MSASSKPTPIAIPNELTEKIAAAAARIGKSKQEVMRIAMEIGLEDLSRIDYDLASAVVDAVRGPSKIEKIEKPFRITKLISSPADLKVAEAGPSYSPAPPPAPGSTAQKSTRDRIAESLVSDAESKKAGAGSGARKPRQ